MTTGKQKVTFRGGELHGLVVECSDQLAARLHGMRLSVTPGGKLYDRERSRYVTGAEVVELPTGR